MNALQSFRATARLTAFLALASCGAAPTPARAAPPPITAAPSAALLARCRAAKPSTNSPLHVVWRADRFSSLFWSVDQWSMWDERQASDVYESFFRKELAADPRDREMLARYRKLRSAYSRRRDEDPPDPTNSVDMLPPEPTPEDEFARAFFCAGDARAAATLIGMSPEEIAEEGRIFDHFSARLALTVGAPYLERVQHQMEAMAERSKMATFLDRVIDFYGSRARVPGELTVELLWAPPESQQATALDDRMVVPITEHNAEDPQRLASWVGVAVHEFGHQLLACITPEERYRVSERIVARGGVVRQRHANIIDEATQAAIGNMFFLRNFLPEGFDNENIYSFEPRLDFPDAIDSLARRAEPLVAYAFEHHEPFGGAYLDRLLDEQTKLMPSRLGDFTRVGFVLAGSKLARQRFDGLFWGRSRSSFDLVNGDDFAATSARNNGASRWVLLAEEQRTRIQPIAERAGIAASVDALSKVVVVRKAKGCVRAARRPDLNGLPGGYDVVVLGRDAAGLRETLIAIQRGLSPSAATPYCLQ